MDKYKLEYFIKNKNMDKKTLCDILGMSVSAFYRKCNGKTEFTRDEIVKIAEILELSGEDILSIFFTQKVS